MSTLRALLSRLLAIGMLSDGWYAILTGVALLYLAYQLGSVPWSIDPAAPLVAIVLAVAGGWQVQLGVRAERRRRTSMDGPA